MITVTHILGARPQFIKYCPVAQAFKDQKLILGGPPFRNILIHTGQHYDYLMSKVFFDELGLQEPNYHLSVGSGSHGYQTGQILERTEKVLENEKPDLVMVYGDTNSTLGGALAAAKLEIPVAHVEAGLRSFNKSMPEEINRILTDQISSLILCPSQEAIKNLQREGLTDALLQGERVPLNFSLQDDLDGLCFTKNKPLIANVGDIMYDVLLFALERSKGRSRVLERLQLKPREYCLLTIHRAENTQSAEKLSKLLEFVISAAQHLAIIFPIHPRTKGIFGAIKGAAFKDIRVVEPLGYFDLIQALKYSALVFTDSGGLQKEAYWLRVPCVTLREETEWVETVEEGWNVLFKDFEGRHTPQSNIAEAYGDGRAAVRVVNLINQWGRNCHRNASEKHGPDWFGTLGQKHTAQSP